MKSTLERRGEFLCFYWMLHVSGFRMKSWIWDKRSEVHLQLPNFCGLSLWFFYFFLVKSNLAFSFFLYISSLSLFQTVECGTFIPALWRLAVLLSTTWRYSWQICLSSVAQSTSSFFFVFFSRAFQTVVLVMPHVWARAMIDVLLLAELHNGFPSSDFLKMPHSP